MLICVVFLLYFMIIYTCYYVSLMVVLLLLFILLYVGHKYAFMTDLCYGSHPILINK